MKEDDEGSCANEWVEGGRHDERDRGRAGGVDQG